MQHSSRSPEGAKSTPPNVASLAKNGKFALCHHLLISHECLRDVVSGMTYADLVRKYPRGNETECLEKCTCTNNWEINERAAQTTLQKQSSKSSKLSSLKPCRQDSAKPLWIRTFWCLLVAPTTHIFDAPLANFFTKDRVSQVLRGFNVSICRHMRYSDDFVLSCYEPHGVIDRDRCGPGKPCCCSVTSDWGGSKCREDDCTAKFNFYVIHKKSQQKVGPFPAEPGEWLAIGTSKDFPFETAMHPSWTGCAIGPDEFDDDVANHINWNAHREKCASENRQWYYQACVDKLKRTAGVDFGCKYGRIGGDDGHVSEQDTKLAPTSQGLLQLPGVEQVSEGSPPPSSI